MKTKICNKCNEEKFIENFYKSRNKDGYENSCKTCRIQNMKKAPSYQPEIKKKYRKKYYQENIEKDKFYKKDNKEQIQSYKQNYYKSNQNYYRDLEKEYRHTEKGREARFRAELKRRSNKNNVKFSMTIRKSILERDFYTCQLCGIKVHDRSTGNWNTPDKAHIDHIIALINGGPSVSSNLWTLCRTCNLTKRTKNIRELI